MSLPNGGFPPVKYCKSKNTKPTKKNKYYSFAKDFQTDLNIEQILDTSNKKPLIEITDTDSIEEIEEI